MKTPSDDYTLPEGWKMAVSASHGNKRYFINQQTKETTWIDPRDKYWKKMTWEECGPDETPYGWEVVEDPVIGRYFIDHVNKRNVLDDPRDKVSLQHMTEVKKHVEDTKKNIAEKTGTLRMKKEEMNKLKAALKAGSGPNPEMDRAQSEIEKLETDITSSSKAVEQMDTVLEAMEEEDDNAQLERQRAIQSEIDSVKQKLTLQVETRERIHKNLSEMGQKFATANRGDLKKMAETFSDEPSKDSGIASGSHASPSDNGVFGMELKPVPKSRIERELELLELRRQLDIETAETNRLKKVAEQAREEIEKAMEMEDGDALGRKPEWIQKLNNYASKSQTVRLNVRKKQAESVESGDVLSFRQKLLFFTSSPLSN